MEAYGLPSRNSLRHQASEVRPPGLIWRCGGLCARVQGKYEEAKPLLHRAMAITEAALGEDHPDFSIRLNNLASLLEYQVGIAGFS